MANTNQIGTTKTQRRKLAKEKKQAERRRAKRKRQIRRWGATSLAVVLFLVIGYVIFFYKPWASSRGLLRVAKPEYNFGVVSVAEGVKEAKIPLINIGERGLTITGLESSCGCTTASIVNNEVEGPRFSMASHRMNRKDWSTVIKPGAQAFLKVYFNPTVMPKLRGPITRIVTVHSDDPVNSEQEVRIKVYQIR
ncbi:MAG: DUF1573 domain-containing protein [Desulfatiglandales bacterium]